MSGYSTTPLKQKLGIKEGLSIAIIASPEGFIRLLDLPSYLEIDYELKEQYHFIHFFATEKYELEMQFSNLKSHLSSQGMLWISWPKKTATIKSDLDENIIRDIGLAAGLVDVKVCAIDEDWSGLKFVYRLTDR
ncbi:DUF3052 family protein [soil metagenome]